jgi:hypothetical protein
MGELGLPARRVDLGDAIDLVRDALDRTARIGWEIPSLERQPVLERIDRWVLRPRAGRRPAGGA